MSLNKAFSLRLLLLPVCVIALFIFSAALPVIYASPNSSAANTVSSSKAPVASCGAAPFQITINTPSAYDWSMFQHDSARTGQVLMPAPYTNKILGTGQVRGAVTQSITTGGNQLYAEGTSLLYAFNSSTLTQFWTFQITGKATISTSATYSAGSLYMGTTAGNLYSISASTGLQNWVYPTTGTIGAVHSNPVVVNGMVIFGSDDGKIYALSTSTGALLWSFQTAGTVRSSPSVGSGIIAVGSSDNILYLLNETTGSLVNPGFVTGGPILSSPAFGANGVVYFGSNDGSVYAVNSRTGALVWSFATLGAVSSSPSISASGSIFVGSQDGNVYAFGAGGNLLWKTAVVGQVNSSGAIGEGVFKNINHPFVELYYVPSTSGTLYAIRTDNGTITWQLGLAGPVTDSPALAYTKLYIGGSTGVITQVGALRFATPVNTFNAAGVAQSAFNSSTAIVVGANAAWGKMGIRGYIVNVTTSAKGHAITLCDQVMTFSSNTPLYNLNFTIPAHTLAPGTYKINVAIEDANPKVGSNNPRCCGWVNFKTSVTITA